jgi:predicted membrane protein
MWRCCARAVSLAGGLAIAATLFIYPRILGTHLGPLEHSALPLMLLGMSGAFAYGFGFQPESKIGGVLFGPAAAWCLMLSAAALMLLDRFQEFSR